MCSILETQQLAILRYRGAKTVEPKTDLEDSINSKLNPYDKGTESAEAICIARLTALKPDDISLTREPDHQFFITIDTQNLDNFDYHRENLYGYWKVRESKRSTSLQLNHISFKMPNFPPLTQPELIKPKQFCNYSNLLCTAQQHCRTYFHWCRFRQIKPPYALIRVLLLSGGNGKSRRQVKH
ncbi:hypothetical protein TSAR_010876 [Trichomalopsis sarcophagae]|uniref:Uncharacterized protein n=1 Tax=Trichomalopsis sarcophagae TaxID=543379 RepID=A0A232F3G3_9HYME|nr:hypothetical protein TSAR_010876 [Trichomalopsis sarcophagae]